MSVVGPLETSRRRLDRWLTWVPYGALLCSTLIVPIGTAADVPHQPYPIVGGSVLFTAAWMFWWTTWHPEWERDRRRMTVFFVGLVALIYLLIWCSPIFGFYAWTGYLFVAYALHGRLTRLAGATSVAVATALSQAGGFPAMAHRGSWGYFAILLLFNITIAGSMTMLATMNDEQTAKRAEMIRQLAEANAKLEAALTENAGLHAQLLVQAREAGVHDERQRMAGEIHDVLAQGLTGIVTQLEAASSGEWVRHIETAKKLARESLTEARRSVQALRPQPLDSSALPEALDEVVSTWSGRHDVRASLITTGAPRPLLPEIETTLLRTAQEALANVSRHAGADRVFLTLSYMEDVVTLDVRDDGAGFDPSVPVKESSYGLAAMRERVLRIAGTLSVESEPGNGTAVSACVPALGLAAA
ncbi:sensor histidine kinase [Actinoplanes sp. KI2]|uniref:sensor histidine kinase n=1 Tax=Actinoplanes sp. KI2 TaxID=2983315 RepID=UPI0021D5D1EF|nr:sensor histidine kinase [Actinoplanes sp. KI2]MCU7724753.1 sensor histidine kinase [Actinoplanes sp. KI2]